MSPYGSFLIIQPDKSRVTFEIPGTALTIGSEKESGLVLPHKGVADVHARFEWRQGVPFVLDMSGGGGIYVNQALVREVALNQGDVIRLGEVFMVFHPPAAPPGQTPGQSSQPAPFPQPATPPPGGGPSLAASATRMPSIVPGAVSLQQLSTNQNMRLGRDPSNQIVLNSLQVSRFHAEVVGQAGRYQIRDLGSTNGTFVNGQRIPPQTAIPLERGNLIRISDYSFHFDGSKLEHYSEEGNARIDAMRLRRVVSGGRVILNDVSLSIHPREFVAVVGKSGVGKSTLVSALSGFRPADGGQVLLNGVDYYSHLEAFRSTLGYVPQDDIIHPELTTWRALYYAALLRMPDDVSAAEREGRLLEVLHDLQLTERRDVEVSRLSGGQRKRVSIGVELLTRPRLFYLDEPTSGLDPGMEADMMHLFRRLADLGHTLIIITHAPANIMLCDKIAFVAEGGRLIFFGPPREALEFFGARDFADIYLKFQDEHTAERLAIEWESRFRASVYHQRYVEARLNEVAALVAQTQRLPSGPDLSSRQTVGTSRDGSNSPSDPPESMRTPSKRGSPLRQLSVLTQRYFEIIRRDRLNLSILLGQAPVLGFILLILLAGNTHPFEMPTDTAKITEGAGTMKVLLFLLTLFSLMCGTINAVREIVKEQTIYKRERTVNLRIFPYLLSKFLVLAAISGLQSAVLVGLVLGFLKSPPGSEHFLSQAFLVLFLVNLAGMSIGLAVSASVPNQNIAVTLLPVVLLAQIVLSGILKPFPDGVTSWLPPLTVMRWGFGMLGNLAHATVNWRVGGQSMLNPPELWNVSVWPGQDGLGGAIPLIVYALLALSVACTMLEQKDHRKD